MPMFRIKYLFIIKDSIMYSVRLPEELELNLTALAKQLHIAKSKVVIDALTRYIEDAQDYLMASSIYASDNQRYTHEELLRELGL